jgi:hypothetical protein
MDQRNIVVFGSFRSERFNVMDRSTLVRLLGFLATLIHGSPLTLDRWMLLKQWLPKNGENLIDVGCRSGAFTIGAARRG